ncbi:hypothetical protein VTK56DRAFT_632 [Thermocarpiscus australiensis]
MNGDLVVRREEKLALARELQRRHLSGDSDLPDNLSVSSLSLADTTGRTAGRVPYNFTKYLSRAEDGPAAIPGLSTLRPKAETTAQPNPASLVTSEGEFPRLPLQQSRTQKNTDLLKNLQSDKAKQQAGNQWAQKKALFPSAPAAVSPTPEQLEAAQKPGQSRETAWPPDDPRNPSWDPKKYFVTYTKKYRCPHDRCP